MSGRDYLAAIKAELLAGRRQHRMAENILAAFGYVRRRRAAIDDINAALLELGLRANPPISQEIGTSISSHPVLTRVGNA